MKLLTIAGFLLLAATRAQAQLPAIITPSDEVAGSTPSVVGYNLGHFFPGSNTAAWWAYSGVNGARIWSNPSEIEPYSSDDIAPFGDGVVDLATFNARRTALRTDPLNPAFVNWSHFADRYANHPITGNNMYLAHAFQTLADMGMAFNVVVSRSESSYPWNSAATAEGWADRWEHWQHHYAQAFYLARYYGAARFQMCNEPDHTSHADLSQQEYLERLQFASDAIQCALADVNRLFGKSLAAEVQAPVSAGGFDKFYAHSGGDTRDDVTGWGELVIRNLHRDYTGEVVPGFNLIQTYDYHRYNIETWEFGAELETIRDAVAAESGGAAIKMGLSEFNVHTAGVLATMTETLDSPSQITRMGGILASLANHRPDELYIFKFSQTANFADGTVKKNGVHYVDNNIEPYNIGGLTRVGQVTRLFARRFGGAKRLLAAPARSGTGAGSLSMAACRDQDGSRYSLLLSNASETDDVDLTIDCAPWRILPGIVVTVEEVSARFHGEVVRSVAVPESGVLQLRQPASSVWLVTVPTAPAASETVVVATDDAMVKAGSNANSNYGASANLWVKANQANPAARNVSLIKFDLGAIEPASIQQAVLQVTAQNPGGAGVVVAHAYGTTDDTWTEETVTWSQVPNLSVAMGHDGSGTIDQIADNFMLGVGQTAKIVGHLSADGTSGVLMLDVTDFVRAHGDRYVTFLITREARFDGDVDDVNFLRMASKEDGTVPPPSLRVLTRRTTSRPDFDGDGDVDQEDFGHMQACLTPVSDLVVPKCFNADLDGDDRILSSDADLFLLCATGPRIGMDPACLAQ